MEVDNTYRPLYFRTMSELIILIHGGIEYIKNACL